MRGPRDTRSSDHKPKPACGTTQTTKGKKRERRRWSGRRVSNSRPQPWQGCALPTELLPHRVGCVDAQKGACKFCGAGDESRTRDLNLGKVALYQLSYSRAAKNAHCTRAKPPVKEFAKIFLPLRKSPKREVNDARRPFPPACGGLCRRFWKTNLPCPRENARTSNLIESRLLSKSRMRTAPCAGLSDGKAKKTALD